MKRNTIKIGFKKKSKTGYRVCPSVSFTIAEHNLQKARSSLMTRQNFGTYDEATLAARLIGSQQPCLTAEMSIVPSL